MRIGLNATCLNERPSGAQQRFAGIYGELVKRLPAAEFIIYEPVDCRVSSWFDGAANVSARQTPIPSEGRARKFIGGIRYWRSSLQHEGLDLFEIFNLPLVKAPAGHTLLTIHDLRGLRPEYSSLERTVFKAALARSLRAADHVITVSETMKEEILSFYPGAPVSVIYNGLDARAFDRISESDLSAVRRKFALPDEFILTVGHFEKRKNYLRLVEAMARLHDRGQSCPLLIIGNDSGEGQEIRRRVASARLSGRVRLLSGLTDLEVRCAYKLCSLFVFPSSYEGFGVPILEAMAARRPMILSDIPVFRELTQDKGVYFHHHDIESMAFAIENLLSSSSERARLVEYGSKRVQTFSFHNLAAQLERLYRSLT